jgi:hypothetical protein
METALWKGGWGRTASVRPQSAKIWGLAALDSSHPAIISMFSQLRAKPCR